MIVVGTVELAVTSWGDAVGSQGGAFGSPAVEYRVRGASASKMAMFGVVDGVSSVVLSSVAPIVFGVLFDVVLAGLHVVFNKGRGVVGCRGSDLSRVVPCVCDCGSAGRASSAHTGNVHCTTTAGARCMLPSCSCRRGGWVFR